jgi:hypothetical protein
MQQRSRPTLTTFLAIACHRSFRAAPVERGVSAFALVSEIRSIERRAKRRRSSNGYGESVERISEP